MSENQVLLENHKWDVEVQEQYLDKGLYRLYLKEFGKDFAGLKFYTLQFVTTDEISPEQAVQNAVEKYGAEVVLDLVNNGVHYGTRARVKNSKIPKYDDKEATREAVAKLAASEPIVFSAEDAENFKPGTRELSVTGIANLIKKAMKEGNIMQAVELGKQLVAAMEKEQKLQAALES